ncbi:hypothetical protein HDU82_000774 [Entophlyctis luteolus]|nr:hypothetical protein HDU82_000774 [Entophlyctis luteolus]
MKWFTKQSGTPSAPDIAAEVAKPAPVAPMFSKHDAIKAMFMAHGKFDTDAINGLKSSDCIHEVRPSTLNIAPKTNAEYEAYLNAGIKPFFSRFDLEIVELVEGADCASVLARSTGDTVVGPYSNEYSMFFWFDPTGKIVRIIEFVDSMGSADFFKNKMYPYIAAKKQEAEANSAAASAE